jgi:hypothetical protein
VELDPLHLRDSEEYFGDDKEIVLTAVSRKAQLIEYASNRLRNSRDFLLRAISVNGGVYEDMPEHTRADRGSESKRPGTRTYVAGDEG